MSPADVTITFNNEFFDTVMRSAGVRAIAKKAAQTALAKAQASAPVDTGAYRAGLHLEEHSAAYRYSERVVGSDPKTLLIESKTGNLARALKGIR